MVVYGGGFRKLVMVFCDGSGDSDGDSDGDIDGDADGGGDGTPPSL